MNPRKHKEGIKLQSITSYIVSPVIEEFNENQFTSVLMHYVIQVIENPNKVSNNRSEPIRFSISQE